MTRKTKVIEYLWGVTISLDVLVSIPIQIQYATDVGIWLLKLYTTSTRRTSAYGYLKSSDGPDSVFGTGPCPD